MENSEADCRQVIAALYQYIDGEIAGVECSQIELHISRCGDCLQHAEFERAFKLLIKRKCTESSIPPGLLERLRELF